MLNNYIKKYWRIFFLSILAILFLIGTSYTNYKTQFYYNEKGEEFVKWLSPDETANYIFSKYYAQTGNLVIHEKYNKISSDIMHPRSFRSDDGDLKPVSFLGIILIYGKIASLTSYKIIPYLTPFFASLTIIVFYLLIKIFWGKQNAFISAIILAVFPPFIYYSTRSMFHNVLLVSLLISALYFGSLSLVIKTKNSWKPILFASLSGFFTGLAITVRTSELMWILPAIFVLWIFNFKKFGIIKILVFIFFLTISLLPFFYYNKMLYGSFFFGGYPEMNQSIVEIVNAGSKIVSETASSGFSNYLNQVKIIKDNVFHFGFNRNLSIKMFINYFVKMFPFIFYFGVLGLLAFYSRFKKNKKWSYAFISAYSIFSLILIFYYGSWIFHDNPDKSKFTIGNSYTRYWLPVYIGLFPFTSYFILAISRAISNYSSKALNKIKFLSSESNTRIIKSTIYFLSQFAFVILIFIISIKFVLSGSEEGLIYQKEKQVLAINEWRDVINLTERNSVIITIYHDKLFFPERKVIVGDFSDKNLIKIYENVANELPLYYYNFTLPEESVNYLNTKRLRENGLRIDKIEEINNNFTLYKINKKY